MILKQYGKVKLAFIILLVSTICVNLQTQHVEALIPSIVSVNYARSGTHTILNVTVNHTPPPSISPSHYVTVIEIDVNGTIHDLNQTTPQSTETFLVQYDIGEITAPLSVRARAFCILHGWGDWSNTITVPEHSFLSIALVLMACATVILVLKLRRGAARRKRVFNQCRAFDPVTS